MAASAIALLGLVGTANAAPATQPADGTSPKDAVEQFYPEPPTGTLRIHKHLGDTTGQDNNGQEQDIDRPVFSGIQFDISRVQDVDLLDGGTGWQRVLDLKEALEQGGVLPAKVTPQTRVTTDTQGEASAELPVGLYLVTEIVQEPSDIVVAKPFLVTIPYPSDDSVMSDNPYWLWNVNVYPKNYMDNHPYKEVTDPDNVQWTVGSHIPWIVTSSQMGVLRSVQGRGGKITNYHVHDKLDPHTKFVSGSVSVTPVKDSTCEGASTECYKGSGTVKFVEDEDYFVHYNPADTQGGELVVQMSAAGVTKMNDELGFSTRLEIAFKASLEEASATGEIHNTATEYTNIGGEDGKGPTPTEPPTTKPTVPPVSPPVTGPVGPGEPGEHTNEVHNFWGSVKLDKVDKDNPLQTLEGAKFSALKGTCEEYRTQSWTQVKDSGQWVKDAGLDTQEWTSASDGEVQIDALYVGRVNTYDGSKYCTSEDGCKYNSYEEAYARMTRSYCLVEVHAPAGYLLPKWPKNTFDVTVEPGQGNGEFNYLKVTNQKTGGPDLPITGAAMTVALIIIGSVLFVAATTMIVISRRRNRETEEAQA